MIQLDTNLISQPLNKRPSGQVVRWLDAQPPERLCPSTIKEPDEASLRLLPGGWRAQRASAGAR